MLFDWPSNGLLSVVVNDFNSSGLITEKDEYDYGSYQAGPLLRQTLTSYDAIGRVINNPQWQLDANVIYAMPYTYDLIGDMLTYSYPSGNVVTQTFNLAGRPTHATNSWTSSQNPATLVSGVHYNAVGAVTVETQGNGLTETSAFNGLLQPCRLNANSSGTQLSSCTASVPSGNVLDLTTGFNYGSGDNGNVMSWAAVGQQTFNRSYTYDGVNRLSTMSAPGSTCSGLSWSYDQWGNRTAQNVTGGTCGSSQLGYNGYNHVTNSGFQYDAAGNMTHDASHSYTYDAENRITKVDGGSTATYVYDASGRRASKTVSGVETDFYYDLSGHVIATYGGGCGATCWNTGFVYLNGQIVAQYWGGTYFVHGDHLGSTRLLTGYPTPSVVECDDYYPFGELISCGGTSITTHKFTGKERDSESNLDNFGARYDSSAMGRFMSPDWSAKPQSVPYATFSNPQSLNLYSYVQNNPITTADRDGHEDGYTYNPDGSMSDPFASQQPMSSTEKQIDVGILEVASAVFSGGATLDAAAAGKITTTLIGALTTTGLAVSGSTRIMGTAAGTGPAKLDSGATAVTTVTNPAGLAVTLATGGNLAAGAKAADLSSAASMVQKPADAAKDPAGTILNLKSLSQDAKEAYNAVKNFVSPPSPPSPPPPVPPSCRSAGMPAGCHP